MSDLVSIIEKYKTEKQALEEGAIAGALKFFMDYHRKNKGDVQRDLWKASRITNVDYRKLEAALHNEINRRMIPKEFGFRKDLLGKLA